MKNEERKKVNINEIIPGSILDEVLTQGILLRKTRRQIQEDLDNALQKLNELYKEKWEKRP